MTDELELSAAGLIQSHEKRCTVEQFVKDAKQPLGLGYYQDHPYPAAVTHLHPVDFAYALLIHLRLGRDGAQGQRTCPKAVRLSTAVAPEELRRLVSADLLGCLRGKSQGESVIAELERPRVA
jgi:hypothetical protein